MKIRAFQSARPLALLAASLVALGVAPLAIAADTSAAAEGCAQQFEVAQKLDMESFRDFDADTFRAGHDDRAVTVFASGAARCATASTRS